MRGGPFAEIEEAVTSLEVARQAFRTEALIPVPISQQSSVETTVITGADRRFSGFFAPMFHGKQVAGVLAVRAGTGRIPEKRIRYVSPS